MTLLLLDDSGFTHPVQHDVAGQQAADLIAQSRTLVARYGVTHPVPVKMRDGAGTMVSI
jgi:hypothetical protein